MHSYRTKTNKACLHVAQAWWYVCILLSILQSTVAVKQLCGMLFVCVVLCRRLAQHFVNNLWAIASTTPFYSVQVSSHSSSVPLGAAHCHGIAWYSGVQFVLLFCKKRTEKAHLQGSCGKPGSASASASVCVCSSPS